MSKFETLLKVPDIHDQLSGNNDKVNTCKILMAHLAEIFKHLSTVGMEMLYHSAPLTFDQWFNLVEWAAGALKYKPEDKNVVDFMEAVIARGVQDGHHYITTVGLEEITREARGYLGFREATDGDSVSQKFWQQHSQGSKWVSVLCYQLERVSREGKTKLSRLVMEKVVVPFGVRDGQFNPETKKHYQWIDQLAKIRFPEDLPAQMDWMRSVNESISVLIRRKSLE